MFLIRFYLVEYIRSSATTNLVGGSFTFSGELAALSSGVTCSQEKGNKFISDMKDILDQLRENFHRTREILLQFGAESEG